MESKSEIARILAQIAQEYEAAQNGLNGLAQGTTRHSFITTKMENMGKLQEELEKIVGDEAIGMITMKLDQVQNPTSSTP